MSQLKEWFGLIGVSGFPRREKGGGDSPSRRLPQRIFRLAPLLIWSLLSGGARPEVVTGYSSPASLPVVSTAIPEDLGDKPFLVGAASCASGNCHGSSRPRQGSDINQNEYRIWATRDRHARAYEVLWGELSTRIARRLGIDNPREDRRCLSCHAVDRTGKVAATTFDPADGVSCEGCHGPSGGWYARHFEKGWTRQQSLDAGMYDTRDPLLRARLCLSCHLGSAENRVDHRLIAAGHPDLGFELEKYSLAMPRHWQEEDGVASLRRWAVGQVLAFGEEMALVEAADAQAWHGGLDFAFLECSSCHHDLRTPSVRQQRGYRFRPGAAPWNPARLSALLPLLRLLTPEQARSLQESVKEFETAAAAADSETIERLAASMAERMEEIVPGLLEREFEPGWARQLLRALAREAVAISGQGIRAAEQAAMAVEVLVRAMGDDPDAARLEQRLEMLYRSLDPYDPRVFAERLEAMGR